MPRNLATASYDQALVLSPDGAARLLRWKRPCTASDVCQVFAGCDVVIGTSFVRHASHEDQDVNRDAMTLVAKIGLFVPHDLRGDVAIVGFRLVDEDAIPGFLRSFGIS